MAIQEKLQKKGPRKLLALDGGGIRGIITLEVLAALEQQLQRETGAGNEFVLAHYFDYVAGTSTGAIIATCLALGMKVSAIQQFYLESGPAMFDKERLLRRYLHNTYRDEQLAAKLREVIRQQSGEDEATLGSAQLQTLLLLVLRNATTDSAWPLTNNPAAKYNELSRHNCNLHLPLWQLVRASTAAPTYFPPEVITVGQEEFVFVDGGVTMYNNPAFQLFLMATLEPYRLMWPTGTDQLLLVSVGTGTAAEANAHLQPGKMNKLYNALSVPAALMHAAATEQDMLCRVFGDCRHGGELDREVLDLRGTISTGSLGPKLFTYLRYNADLSATGLANLGLTHIEPEQAEVEKTLTGQAVVLLNPRRDDWNKEWKPVSTDANFRAQVQWELAALEAADIIGNVDIVAERYHIDTYPTLAAMSKALQASSGIEAAWQDQLDVLDNRVRVLKVGHEALEAVDQVATKYSWLLSQLRAIEEAQYIVIIGGRLGGSSDLLIRIAEAQRKQLVPLPLFGGVGAACFARKRYQLRDTWGEEACRLLEREITGPQLVAMLMQQRSRQAATTLQAHYEPASFFISYPWERPVEADLVEMILRRRSYEVLRDEQDFAPGEHIPQAIQERIRQSTVFIALWCREYACSPWCYDELALALQTHIIAGKALWIFNLDATRMVHPQARERLLIPAGSRR
nr:hypothetical protein [Tanacetum cinerariifolium]